nr:hypothetical protein [Brevundimonas diminuta]
MDHKLTLEPQPIADQWMAKCSCGWRATESFWTTPDRDDLLAKLKERYQAHMNKPAQA